MTQPRALVQGPPLPRGLQASCLAPAVAPRRPQGSASVPLCDVLG